MNRQTEFILAIIGASFNMIVALIAAFFTGVNLLPLIFSMGLGDASGEILAFLILVLIGAVIFIFLVASSIFGMIAAFKLKAGTSRLKTIAIIFIVVGGIQIASIHGILYLIVGIMLLSKKQQNVLPEREEELI